MKRLFIFLAVFALGLLCLSAGFAEEWADVQPGDTISFGQYPQAADGTDCFPVEWLVLEVQSGKALLISSLGLDVKPYHTVEEDVTWETCSLREWLNNEFLNTAFSPEEQALIQETEVDNRFSQGYSEWLSEGGNNTSDRIFLLSCAEARRYFRVLYGDTENLKARLAPTGYAAAREAYISSLSKTEEDAAAGYWWLRSQGHFQDDAAVVDFDGSLSDEPVESDDVLVRPCFWLTLDSGSAIPEDSTLPAGSFTFRNGIAWKMRETDVIEREGKREYRNILMDDLSVVSYENIPVSRYQGELAYLFLSDRLILSVYTLRDDEAYAGRFEGLEKALCAVYGKELTVSVKEVYETMKSIAGDRMQSGEPEDKPAGKWLEPDGTVIYLMKETGMIEILYVSPDCTISDPDPEAEEMDVTGL